jgi:hypothetical protein
VRRSEHKEDADKIRKTCDILVGKLQEKKTTSKTRHKQQDNIKREN